MRSALPLRCSVKMRSRSWSSPLASCDLHPPKKLVGASFPYPSVKLERSGYSSVLISGLLPRLSTTDNVSLPFCYSVAAIITQSNEMQRQ